MANQSGPRPLWVLAHTAVEHGYDVTIQPRGSSVTLFARRERVEVVARWKRADRHYQGDGGGRWKPDGRPSVTSGGDYAWINLSELPGRLARPHAEVPASESVEEPDSPEPLGGCHCAGCETERAAVTGAALSRPSADTKEETP